MKLLVLLAMVGFGGYKLHRATGRWIRMLSPLVGGDGEDSAGRDPSDHRPLPAAWGARWRPSRRAILRAPINALALIGLLSVGRWVTRMAVSDELDLRGDMAAATVARSSSALAAAMLNHPVERLMIPDWRVVDVRREPGHCTEPFAQPELRDYVADLRLYTLYALPWRTVTVTCGGTSW